MRITDITPNPDNPRTITKERMEKLKKSITEFEKMMAARPIVIDENGVILGGNMRYAALQALGYTEIPDEWVKRVEDFSEEEKKRFIIEDNVAFGDWDWDKLANEWDENNLRDWGLDLMWEEDGELPKDKQAVIKAKKKALANEIYNSIKGRTVEQVIDKGEKIQIHFTKKGVDHFCNDAMLTLSGKYFSEKSMKRVDEILAKAKYVASEHKSKYSRKDGRDLWFRYKDAEGRGVYFKVTKQTNGAMYELYSVTDKY